MKQFPYIPQRREIVSGWGKTNKTLIQSLQPKNILQLQEIIVKASHQSIIPRGLGRSYGDAAQLENSYVVNLKLFNKIKINDEDQTVTTGAGVTINQLLKVIIPAGFFLPVTPGTKNVTVGGAISSDVHGKNHHVAGSFGEHVKELRIIDGKGELHSLSKKESASSKDLEYFWSTIGGMGLTGVIVEATFSLLPITTSLVKVESLKCNNLDSLMDAMVKADRTYRYSVAWIDSLHSQGRGVLTCGDHLEIDESNSNKNREPLCYKSKPTILAPSFIPNGVVNKFTTRAFNEYWFRKSSLKRTKTFQKVENFFYPLDAVGNWNKFYGSKGFIQYQFVIPDKSSFLIQKTIESLKKISAFSFLTVLKRFGQANPAPLSFPKPGWTLAIDIPAAVPELFETLDKLDQLIVSNNGKLYLAKDSRMSSETFKSTYPFLENWREVKETVDPRRVFYSDLARRLEI